MALQITKQMAHQAMKRLESAKAHVARLRENSEQITKKVIGTVEVAGAAFGMGVLQGRTGGIEVFGVPVELAAGLGLVGFSLLGGGGKQGEHLTNIGTGCLAAYATTLGRGVGATWKGKETRTSGNSISAGSGGMPLNPGMGMPLTPAEVAQMQAAGVV